MLVFVRLANLRLAFSFSLADKIAQGHTGWWETTGPATGRWLISVASQIPLFAALSVVGLTHAFTRKRWMLLLVGWPALRVCSYALLRVAFYPWYLAPLHRTLAIMAALGAKALVRLAESWDRKTLPLAATVLLVTWALLAAPHLQVAWQMGRGIPDTGARQYKAVGAWLRQHTDQDSTVAALGMGRLGYVSERMMFDFVGLIRPPILNHLTNRDLVGSVQHYRPE